jgi:uncharacterized membrane protein
MGLLLSESLATKIFQVVAYVILSTDPCFEARYSDSIFVPVLIVVSNLSIGVLFTASGLPFDSYFYDSEYHQIKIVGLYILLTVHPEAIVDFQPT